MQLKSVSLSAPGKIILHGEHAVVYGREALACSLSLRTRCTVNLTDNSNNIQICLDALALNKSFDKSNFTTFKYDFDKCDASQMSEDAIEEIKSKCFPQGFNSTQDLVCLICLVLYLGIAHDHLIDSSTGLLLILSSDLPFGAGVGSSASLCVSVAGALLALFGIGEPIPVSEKLASDSFVWKDEDLTLINKWAYIGETLVHGTPSGVDNTVSTYGGLLSFRTGVKTFIKKLPRLKLLLIDSKVSRSTKSLVQGVKERHMKIPDVYNSLFDAIEKVTYEAKNCLNRMSVDTKDEHSSTEETELYDKLEELIRINHNLLNAIGVGHSALSSIIEILASCDLHGKITGAGGGGCIFALIKPEFSSSGIERVCKKLEGAGFAAWQVEICGHGIRMDTYA